jgi:hypothetical protein
MKRTLIVRTTLLLVLAMVCAGTPGAHGQGVQRVLASDPGSTQSAPQASQVPPAQPGIGRGDVPGGRQNSMAGMPGMPGMRGQTPGNLERLPKQPVQQAPQGLPSQTAAGQGAFQNLPKQQPVAAMDGMGAMSRAVDQGLTMREVLFILSIQDALQVMTELLSVQERLLADPKGSEKEYLRKELARIRDQAHKITGDYRAVMSGQLRGD